ncbi:MAG: hypothetical protein V1763_01805 [Parcubacteria group bacterium]
MHEDSRHITLWVSVVIVGAIIFVGWLYALRYSFQQAGVNNQTGAQVTNDIASSFQALNDAIDSSDNSSALSNATTQLNDLNAQLQQGGLPSLEFNGTK